MTTYEVTLKVLRQEKACIEGYNRVVCSLQGQPFTNKHRNMKSYIRFAYEEPISLSFILENNGLDDALWAMHCIKDAYRDISLFSVWCARQVQHLMRDSRSTNALDVVERFANGKATKEELEAASAAAWDASVDASAARAAQTEMFKLMCEGKAPWQVSGLD